MKKYIITMLLLIMGATFSACGSGNATPTSPGDNQESATSNTAATSDSMMIANKVLLDSIGRVDKRVEELKAKSTEASNSLQKDVSFLRGLVLGLGGFCVLCLILTFMALMWCKKLKEKGMQQHDDIKNLRNRVGNGNVAATSVVGKPSTNEYLDLKSRVIVLENTLKSMRSKPTYQPQQPQRSGASVQTTMKAPVREEKSVRAYFGNPTMGEKNGYFKKAMESRDSDARFEASIQGDKATFKPLTDSDAAKKTLITSDQMKLAVEFSGCSPAETHAMRILAPGVAEKMENGRWEVKTKAKIELIK